MGWQPLCGMASLTPAALPCVPAAAREHGLQHEVLSSAQVASRFPAYRLPPNFQTMYEPEGGFLIPERCIEAHLRLAARHGAQLMCGTGVTSWRVLPPGAQPAEDVGSCARTGDSSQGLVQVDTPAGTFTTRRLVLAAGGWMPQMVPELKPLLTVERQVVGWFEVSPEARPHFDPAAMPVFLLQDAHGYYYGAREGSLAHAATLCSPASPRGTPPPPLLAPQASLATSTASRSAGTTTCGRPPPPIPWTGA